MTSRSLTPAAAVMAAATVVLVAWVFRHEIERFLLGAGCFTVAYKMLRHRLFPVRRVGRGNGRRGLWEAAAASLLAFTVGRRTAGTHPCSQCGAPIGAPSRAAYCSPGCRRYAALERAETDRRARSLEGWGDVPY
jgi:hypothetical protein